MSRRMIECPNCHGEGDTMPGERCRECDGSGEIENPDYDPTPWCTGCGARRRVDCHCGPLADND